MTPLLSLILISLLAYFGNILYRKSRFFSPWLKSLTYSGSIYIIIGYLIGPNTLGLLTDTVLNHLNVLVGLVLGWTGFLIGLQAKRTELRRFQKSYFLFATLNMVYMLIGVIIITYFAAKILNIQIGNPYLITFAIMATVSSPILIGVLKRDLKIRGQVIHLLQFSVAYDNMLGILFFGICFIFFSPFIKHELLSIAFIIAALIFSIITAGLFYLLSKEIKNQQQYFLILIGMLLLIVGVALNLNLSLLFTAFIFGISLTNMPINTRNLYQSITNAEKPLYYLLLIFIGASIKNVNTVLLLILIVFVLLRVILKYISGYVSRYSIIRKERPMPIIGLPHVGMGGVALAMVLDFHLAYLDTISQDMLFIIAGSMIVNALLSSPLNRFYLSK